MRTETNLFAPFKALGLICSSVPPAWAPPVLSRAHFHDGYVFCALDNVVAAYGLGRRFRLAFTTEALEEGTVTLLAADSYRHYACFANKTTVAVIRNRTIERRLFIDGALPKLLLSLTDSLVVVDSDSAIHLFDVRSGQQLVRLDSSESFQITAIVHPTIYLNKILVGAADGRMRLWNLCTGRLVHEFPVSDAFNAPIVVLEQSPAIDVIGVGLADGRIHLRNIKFDKLICSFRHGGQITALAFRTDGVDTMVSANSDGSLAIWDLNERQLLGQLSSAHSAKITWLHFVPGQAYLISAGEDNRIVKWFFRSEVALPEIDTALEGHFEPVSAIRFCAEHLLVSAGRDGHVRRFTTGVGEKWSGSVHFGKAREVKKGDLSKDRFMDVLLNPIVQIELSLGREAVWDNMICRHEDSPLVSTWSTRRGTRGSHLFCHERFTKNAHFLDAVVTAMCVSCCGTFALFGHSTGHVDVWNMQSGQWKFELQRQAQQMAKLDGQNAPKPGNIGWKKHRNAPLPAHDGAVTGLALDLTNRHLVTGSDDGTIQFWQFLASGSGAELASRLRVGDAVQQFRLDPHNSLLAVGLRGGEVGVLDILCRRIARRFSHSSCMDWPQNARLTGLDFSSDGKWLVSADNQGFLKVWDLVTGSLIDVMRCATPCVGLAFSERNDFLATCHEGQRGVFLWANKTMFLASYSMWARTDLELHDRAMGSVSALPTTAGQTDANFGDDDDDDDGDRDDNAAQDDAQQQQRSYEAGAVQHGQNRGFIYDDSGEHQRSQAEEVMEEEEEEKQTAQPQRGEMETEQDDDADEDGSTTTRETRVMIDEDEEEEGDEGEGRAPSLSTLSLDGSAELPERAQLDPSLYTLSGLAPARWAGLPHLEHIRQRNKPKEPPKKPKAAPFFLPTVATTKGFEFDAEAVDKLKRNDGGGDEAADDGEQQAEAEESIGMEGTSTMGQADQTEAAGQGTAAEAATRAMLKGKRRTTTTTTEPRQQKQQQQLHTEWTRRLMSATTDDQLRAVFAQLGEMSLSGMDLHLRCLSTDAELAQFVAMLVAQMECRRDFDLAQSFLAAFLNIHHSTMWTSTPTTTVTPSAGASGGNDDDENKTETTTTAESNALRLTRQLERLHTAQRQAHDTLSRLFDDNAAMLEFVKSAIA